MINQESQLNLKKLIIDFHAINLKRAINFYRDILELPLIKQETDWASFEVRGAEIHLYLYGGATQGLEFCVVDIYKEVAILKDKGIEFFTDENQPNLVKTLSNEIMEFTWGYAAFFKDSEGNNLAFVQDED